MNKKGFVWTAGLIIAILFVFITIVTFGGGILAAFKTMKALASIPLWAWILMFVALIWMLTRGKK